MTIKTLAISLCSLTLSLTSTHAQTNLTGAAAPPITPASGGIEQTIRDIKQPFAWLNWGADFRTRNEYFNNAQSLGSDPNTRFGSLHSQDYFRFRGRLWTSITPMDDLSLNARLAAEPREWMEPSSSGNYFGNSGLEWRYGIIDNLNVQWKKLLGLPATLTVGRQDLPMGDNWLFGDGTPADGSWTFFLDSARLTYDMKDQHTTIDAIGILQYARPDAWLPTMGSSTSAGSPSAPYFLTDQNEKGAVLWIANKSVPQANLDGYFIYKHDSRINNAPAAPFGDNGDIYTVGGRLSGLVEDHWKYGVEGAYQFGDKQDPSLNQAGANPLLAPSAQTTGFRDLNAFGINTKLSYLVKDHLNNQFTLAYEFLSGDNPGTGNDEMFDVLWGRWPRWSELYNVYSYVPETRVGQTANVYRFGPGWACNPIKDMDFSITYNALFSDQEVPTRASSATSATVTVPNTALFSQTGNFRGHYLQTVLKYKFSPHMSGHLWSEFVFPGDFYASRQTMTFLRAEVLFTF